MNSVRHLSPTHVVVHQHLERLPCHRRTSLIRNSALLGPHSRKAARRSTVHAGAETWHPNFSIWNYSEFSHSALI